MNNIVDNLKKEWENLIVVETDEDVEVISTSSPSLDVSTGIGGIPKGRLTTIYGAESSAKTSLCLEISKNAIRNGDNVAYIDVEQGLDYRYANTIVGEFDVTKLLIAQPESAEDALGLVEVLISGDKKIGVEAGQYNVIIVDSVAALAPEEEKEKDLTDRNVALAARTLSAFFRRNMFQIKKNNVALIFVNQVRDKIGTYIKGYSLPGGHALLHYSSLIIFLSPGPQIKQGDEPIGMQCRFVIKKNKLSAPFRSFDFPLMFGEGIDTNRDLISFASEMGIIRGKGAYYYYGETQLGQGIVKSMDYLEEHQDIRKEILDKCLGTVKLDKAEKV